MTDRIYEDIKYEIKAARSASTKACNQYVEETTDEAGKVRLAIKL